jgi:hypothetical protein
MMAISKKTGIAYGALISKSRKRYLTMWRDLAIFVATMFEAMTVKEAAIAFGVTPSTIKESNYRTLSWSQEELLKQAALIYTESLNFKGRVA